jgi:hypothetical protein
MRAKELLMTEEGLGLAKLEMEGRCKQSILEEEAEVADHI